MLVSVPAVSGSVDKALARVRLRSLVMIVTMANAKGGVAKTTGAILLAVA